MKSIKKTINDENVVFDYSGGVFLENLKTLIFSDLHLGKSLSLIKNGNFIPSFDIDETLINLKKIVLRYNPNKVIFLGDSFHENKSIQEINDNYINFLNDILKDLEVIWIEGNHDFNLFVKEKITGRFKNSYQLENFNFVHIKNNHPSEKKFEFSGHFHPKVRFRFNRINYNYKCFILTNNFCILPSFGAYTGGLDIRSNELKNIIPLKKTIFALGGNIIKEI